MSEKAKSLLNRETFLAAIVMGLASIVVAWLSFQGGIRESHTNEVVALRQSVTTLTSDVSTAKTELHGFRVLLGAAFNKSPDEINLTEIQEYISANATSLDEMVQFIRTAPIYVWVKRREVDYDGNVRFVMVQCSEYYADNLLGKPARFYSGKTDSQVYDAETAKDFYDNDIVAFREGRLENIEERFYVRLNNKSGTFRGTKWRYSTAQHDYIAGIGTIKFDKPKHRETP